MKASELRIGNFVECYSKHEDKFIQRKIIAVESLDENNDELTYEEASKSSFNIYKFTSKIDAYNSFTRPIPLTEEWLKKFGFTITSSDALLFPLALMISPNGFDYFHNALGHGKFLNVKYVHQLQNLFYALSEQELTISK